MPILDSDLSKARQMFEVNIFGIVAVVQGFSPLLIRSKGTIINIGSANGFAPIPWIRLYNASKAAANHLTDILRQEMVPFGVKVILVISGVVKTNFFNDETGQTLPENSLYLPAKATIKEILSGGSLVKISGG
jgi:short-subunit dehydrogenase